MRPVRLTIVRSTVSDEAYEPFIEDDLDSTEFLGEFDKLLEQSRLKFEVGERIEGLVFDVDDSGVYVNFGGKELGFCSSNELSTVKVSRPTDIIQPNTRRAFEIGATGVKSKKLGGDITLLTRAGIVKEIAYRRLRQMSEFQIKLEVEVIRKNAGGYLVQDNMGMTGFLPGRQALINPATNTNDETDLVGKRITVRVLDLFEDSGRYVVTQRGVGDSDIDEARFQVGSVLEGVVEGVMPYGVFISAGGISGLLHTSQISGAPVEDVSSVFSVNDPVKVMVLGYDRARGRLSLSTKRLEPSSGDMLKNPELVYEKAEEMAEKFRKEVEMAAARVRDAENEPIVSDVTVDASKLEAKKVT